jgi:methyl-accepting chemotaxis protein
MASTSEELSSQAAQLQDSISFFTVAGQAGANTPRISRPAAPRAVKAQPQQQKALTGVKKVSTAPISSGDGVNLDMGLDSDTSDKDFERF